MKEQIQSDMVCLPRIFVVGCPRSGTTLLQSLLAANSHITSFPETHFFEKLFSGWPLLAALGIASRTVWPHWKIVMEAIGHPELSEYLPPHAVFVRQYSNAFVRVLDKLTFEDHKSIWIEKTPGHLRYVSQIEELVENARFVHIVRAGVENIASLHQIAELYPGTWSKWYGTIDQCIERWVEDVRRSQNCSIMKNHYVVMYDQLVDFPSDLLTELCQFIGIPFEENMLTDYTQSASKLILKQEQWKSSVFDQIQKAKESKFNKVFDERERQYVLNRIPEDLLGFALPLQEQIK
jgi:Sulfotransferase family